MVLLQAALVAAVLVVACAAALLAVSMEEAESTFPGKNGKIAFTSTRDGKTGSEDIYTMNPSGTSVERLTNNTAGDFDPDWQPLSGGGHQGGKGFGG
jgi:hypothetical protein